MPAKTIKVRVITNAAEVVADEAVAVRAPGELGYLGILYNHAPLVTTLQPGKLTWRTARGRTRQFHIDEGLLEVTKNQLTVLTNAMTEQLEEDHARN